MVKKFLWSEAISTMWKLLLVSCLVMLIGMVIGLVKLALPAWLSSVVEVSGNC